MTTPNTTPQPEPPKCEACDRGEKTITPPHSGVVGSMAVHYPSGMICTASDEWEELQKRIRICKSADGAEGDNS